MQVTLDAVDWKKLTSFKTAEKYFEWYDAMEDQDAPTISCYDFDDKNHHPAWNDSHLQYAGVARLLEILLRITPRETQVQLQQGLCRIISNGEKVDEFSTSVASDQWCWISASPTTTRHILEYTKSLDVNLLHQCLVGHSSRIQREDIEFLNKSFIPIIKQYIFILEMASSNGYGLLGFRG